jgi:hypothetical protein
MYNEQPVRLCDDTTMEDASSANAIAVGGPPGGKLIL